MSPRVVSVLLGLIAFLSPAAASGVVIVEVRDVHDDRRVVNQVENDPGVVASRRDVEALRERLLRMKARDFRAAFGAPLDPDKVDGALLVAEPRLLGIPSHDPNPATNKAHRDTFAVGEIGRLVAWFGHDGESPMSVQVYLETDPGFPRLDRAEALAKRLEWERPRFARLADEVGRRWRKVVVWELDPGAMNARARGVESGDPAAKFEAVMRWGREQGYALQSGVDDDWSAVWTWRRGEVVMASADGGPVEEGIPPIPEDYRFYRADGALLREENGTMTRWYRRDGETYARIELGRPQNGAWQPYQWSWYDRDGQVVRQEEDDNGDGLPDVWGDNNLVGEEHYQPLTLDASWAVHPERIPEAVREPDLPERRVPLRKIPEPAAPAPRKSPETTR